MSDPGDYTRDLDVRIRAMRALLTAQHPGTDAAALRLLRESFPEVPLSDRLIACGAWKTDAPSATTPP